MGSVAWDKHLLVTPGTLKPRIDEITINGSLPFEATPLETVLGKLWYLWLRTARNVS